MNIIEKRFENGKAGYVYPMTFGKGRMSIGDPGSFTYDDSWCYDSMALAAVALAKWNGEGEPTGWMRHIHTGRRRPGGDPAQEYVQL